MKQPLSSVLAALAVLFSIVSLVSSLRTRAALAGGNHAVEVAKIANEKATCDAWGEGFGPTAPDTALCDIGDSKVFVTAGVGFQPRLECVAGACAKQPTKGTQGAASAPATGPGVLPQSTPTPTPTQIPAAP